MIVFKRDFKRSKVRRTSKETLWINKDLYVCPIKLAGVFNIPMKIQEIHIQLSTTSLKSSASLRLEPREPGGHPSFIKVDNTIEIFHLETTKFLTAMLQKHTVLYAAVDIYY